MAKKAKLKLARGKRCTSRGKASPKKARRTPRKMAAKKKPLTKAELCRRLIKACGGKLGAIKAIVNA